MQPSNVTELLFQQLNFRGERQKVISTNIANIDTPNYKTKDLRFKNQLDQSSSELKMNKTHHGHISNFADEKKSNKIVYKVNGLEEQNDGNNVNLDTQMSQQTQNSVMFTALQNSIKKDSSWFKSMIDSSSKN